MSNVFKVLKKNEEPKKINIRQIVPINETTSTEEMEEDPTLILNEAKRKLIDADKKVKELITNANVQIEQDKQRLEEASQALFEKSKNDGFQAGFEQGKKEAIQTYSQYIDEAVEVIKLAKVEQKAIIDQHEDVILSIAMRVAEKILALKLEEEETFKSLVINAMEEAKGLSKIDIYVNPRDFEEVVQYKQDLQTIVTHDADISILPSKNLERYNCIIETPIGQIDASVDTQLRELKMKLQDYLEEAKRVEAKPNTGLD